MYIKRTYPVLLTFRWSLSNFLIPGLIAAAYVSAYMLLDLDWMLLPWLPISLIGIAVAFFLGFKNNSAYDRLWEARKIWGGIVNSSRTWGIMARDFPSNKFTEHEIPEKNLQGMRKRMIYRHVAWLTALRHQLRAPKTWEHHDPANNTFREHLGVVEYKEKLEEALKPFLSEKELEYVMSKKNRATTCIALQSKEIKSLCEENVLDEFRHNQMAGLLEEFYTLQGKSERIKNFPFPRQYATFNLLSVWTFIILMPLGMITAFKELIGNTGLHDWWLWIVIPFAALVGWVFLTMDKIGEFSENPFEGLWNDIPITALSRTIEIDLRDMLDEEELPAPIQAVQDVLT